MRLNARSLRDGGVEGAVDGEGGGGGCGEVSGDGGWRFGFVGGRGTGVGASGHGEWKEDVEVLIL